MNLVVTLFNGTLALAGRDQETTGFAFSHKEPSLSFYSPLPYAKRLTSLAGRGSEPGGDVQEGSASGSSSDRVTVIEGMRSEAPDSNS